MKKQKARIIKRKTSLTKNSKKFVSHLVTIKEDYPVSDLKGFTDAIKQLEFNFETEFEAIFNSVLLFLDERKIPYDQLPNWRMGSVSKNWLDNYDHIPGVRVALQMLQELYCFTQNRNKNPETAYANLLSLINLQSMLVIADMEAQYFAGSARRGGGENQTEKQNRERKFHREYLKARNLGKSKVHSRQIASKRIGISMSTAKRYSKIKDLK